MPTAWARHASYPTKDETADYLEAYAERFHLPVTTGVRVDRLSRRGQLFDVVAGQRTFTAENVVVATGAYHTPRIPGFPNSSIRPSSSSTPARTAIPPSFGTAGSSSSVPGTPAPRSRSRCRSITRRGCRGAIPARSRPVLGAFPTGS